MAVSKSSTFKNAVQGIPGVGADFDVFANHSSPKFPIGQKYTRSDGAEFVYSHFGATAGTLSTGGIIVAADKAESYFSAMFSNVYASASCTAIAGETIKPNTAGSHYVELIYTGMDADRFAGGYLQTVDGDGCGYTYRVKGNTASSAKTSGANPTLYIELWEPLQQTISTIQNTSIRIVGSVYGNLESASGATNFPIAGVTTCSHGANTFGWVQTKGMAGVRTEATTVSAGYVITLSLAEPGLCTMNLGNASAVSGQVRFQRPIIGYCVASGLASVQDQFVAVNLML